MENILGIDLGPGSIGLFLRESESGNPIYYSTDVFKSGVGKDNGEEFSFAAQRTKFKAVRHSYNSRKYRKWETIKLLIEKNLCPLSDEDFERWYKYDKSKKIKREYPIHAKAFMNWIRLDFNDDGMPEYSTPYEVRYELATKQLDFSIQENRYKLGRAIYHIAQRRGFRSSKGETLKSNEKEEKLNDLSETLDIATVLKRSEEEKSAPLTNYMESHNLPTVGAAFHSLLKEGCRIRNNGKYQAIRSQYKEELSYIFEFQNGLDVNSTLFKRLLSTKKGEGTVFYQRPLRSQKGQVGKCILEPTKPRCPISRPEYEMFRAWQFLNTIKFGEECSRELSLAQKEKIFEELFVKSYRNFEFEKIRQWIEKETGENYSYKRKEKKRFSINYPDSQKVSGCVVAYRLKNLLGQNWKDWKFVSEKTHTDSKRNKIHQVVYNWENVWHVCFVADNEEELASFANDARLDQKKLLQLWSNMYQGYANLSLKAINNILRFLKKGLLYNEACLLAKLPDILKESWNEATENELTQTVYPLIEENKRERFIINAINGLIRNYKALEPDETFAYHDFSYILHESDKKDVKECIINNYGKIQWSELSESEQNEILDKAICYYQNFFHDQNRRFIPIPSVESSLNDFLKKRFPFLTEKQLNKIYHHSQIAYYSPVEGLDIEQNPINLLDSPVLNSLRNPMALRVLHVLRRKINDLLKKKVISESETRVVVEVAKELNDANMRWALDTYDRNRNKENDEYRRILSKHLPEYQITDTNIRQVRLLSEQHDLSTNRKESGIKTSMRYEAYMDSLIKKYRCWKEQSGICIYTGKTIGICNILSDEGDKVDLEHTIPCSISFDDSLQNMTLCYADYNRETKKKRIPYELPKYEDILSRIQPWIEKTERLKKNMEYWILKSKQAQDKEQKDKCIRQMHLWRMEYDYWYNKVSRFTMKEVTPGFRNSQLVDTRIISKYAYLFLKSVFNKVEVQKGSTTAVFRKVLGIQDAYMKKDRSKHSHHAIDAMVLTWIPTAVQRDKMLKLFYEIKEVKQMGENTEELVHLLNIERKKCGLTRNLALDMKYIEDNLLVEYQKRDRALIPSRRRWRVNGKIVPMRDQNGNIIFEADKFDRAGHNLPKAQRWIQGNSIRGQLHKETFYGAIVKLSKEKEAEKKYVVRRELKYAKSKNDSGFKNWDELKNAIVDEHLFELIRKQFDKGTSLKEAVEAGIYMLNKKGERVNKIRHIRCYADSKNPLKLKRQTFVSNKDHKNNYYVGGGDLYAICKYECVDDEKKKPLSEVWSLYEIADNRNHGIDAIPVELLKNNTKYRLISTLKSGDQVLLYKDNVNELYDLDSKSLSRRLYTVNGFEKDKRIALKLCINAQPKQDLGKGRAITNFKDLPILIRCSIKQINYIVKDIDFEIEDGRIKFFDKKQS